MRQIYEAEKLEFLASYIGHGQSFGPNNPGGPPATAAVPAQLVPLAAALPRPLRLYPYHHHCQQLPQHQQGERLHSEITNTTEGRVYIATTERRNHIRKNRIHN
jgi:hypothetical protein